MISEIENIFVKIILIFTEINITNYDQSYESKICFDNSGIHISLHEDLLKLSLIMQSA